MIGGGQAGDSAVFVQERTPIEKNLWATTLIVRLPQRLRRKKREDFSAPQHLCSYLEILFRELLSLPSANIFEICGHRSQAKEAPLVLSRLCAFVDASTRALARWATQKVGRCRWFGLQPP
jgi:hypothetical protein